MATSEEIKVTQHCSVELSLKILRRMNELMAFNEVALGKLFKYENALEQLAKDFNAEIEVVKKSVFENVEDTEKQGMVKYDEIVSELNKKCDNMKLDFYQEVTALKQQ